MHVICIIWITYTLLVYRTCTTYAIYLFASISVELLGSRSVSTEILEGPGTHGREPGALLMDVSISAGPE